MENTENTENTKSVEDYSKFWRDYQEKAWSTCLPSCQNWDYLVLGLHSEIGELCGKFKKKIRGITMIVLKCSWRMLKQK